MAVVILKLPLVHGAIFIGLKLQSHRQNKNGNYSLEWMLPLLKKLGMEQRKGRRGWWKGKEEEWQSLGLRLLSPTNAPTPPHPTAPGTMPCFSSQAPRLENS